MMGNMGNYNGVGDAGEDDDMGVSLDSVVLSYNMQRN